MTVIPPAIQDALERVAERLDRHFATLSALNYISCRKDGGSMLECMGIYRLSSPHPGEPFFDELLNNVEIPERHRLLSAIRDQLLEEVNRIDGQLKLLDQPHK